LTKKIDVYKSNLIVQLAYINTLQKSATENDNSSLGISYAGLGLSKSDSQALASFISEQENYNFSEQQSISILRSTLDPESVKAYLGCLNAAKAVTIIIPDAALSDEAFQVQLDWNPKYRAHKSTATIRMTNGEIVGPSEFPIESSDSIPIIMKRDLDKQLYISAFIDGQSDLIALPARPQFTVKRRQLWVPPLDKPELSMCRSGGCGTQPLTDDYCIQPSDDGMLIPSSFNFHGKVIGLADRAKSTTHALNNSVTNGPSKVCGNISDSAGANEEDNRISGRFFVYELYLEPIHK
jgi:hypothetical protein